MTEQPTLVRSELRRSGTTGVRKDIQALRAIAVGFVVINHLWPELLQGGYVRVDVFFFISGYLITEHLLAQLDETGRLRLGRFYARRAKRLLPAALLVGGVSLAAVWIMLPFSRWTSAAQEALASVFFIENWVLAAKSVDYSAHNEQASTVQHYWSLSVEEQSFLIWSLLLLGFFVLARRKSAGNRVLLHPGRIKLFAQSKPRVTLLSTVAAMSVMALLCGALLAGAGAAQSAEAQRIGDLQNGPCYGGRSMDPENSCLNAFSDPLVNNVGPAEAPRFSEPECKLASNPITVQDKKYLNECDFSDEKQGAADVWLVGDSHAEQWKVGIIELARKNGWRLHESLLGGCPISDATRVASTDVRTRSTAVQQRCLEWSRLASDRILTKKPDMVFVSSFGSKETVDDGSGGSQVEQYASEVRSRIGAWAENGTRILLLRDTPLTLKKTTSECPARNRWNVPACANDRTVALPPDPMAEGVRKLGSANAHVLDLSDQFCDSRSCYAAIGGLHVYFDADQVSRS